ncbi:MAG: alpha-galactosidase [Clostridia bacterium]|nr:alpha-galactosidase [Clostridia bacterium]
MQTKELFFDITCDEGLSCSLVGTSEKNGVTVYDFRLEWTDTAAEKNAGVKLEWYAPMLGFMYRWSPLCGTTRSISPNWCGRRTSMLAVNAPMETIHDGAGKNRYTFAVSECAKRVSYGSGVVEENGGAHFMVQTNVKQYTSQNSASFSIYIDTRDIPMHEAVWGVADWWAVDCGMTPAEVPASALEPVYSFWYSYHQNLTDHDIEEECKRAKALGFNVCIVDDGWQTDDASRGYAFCGEWQHAVSKMGDMAAHVARVHDIGMKYVLWYSVPFMGHNSSNYNDFKDMILYDNPELKAGILDPRYKEVREFLKNIYVKALNEWKLDGFKLDFIDQWNDSARNAPYNEKMDIPAVQDAVDAFMTDVIASLKAVKPDIMLEFRQCYIGPNMRKYGNMFRVGDCPNDYTKNRVGVLDLRMHLGDSAVHSDMLMWHTDELPELAAIQIIGVLFGVLQYSARLDKLTPEMEKMSRFWLDFMKKHSDLLLKARVVPYEPELLYTWAKSTLENECVIAVYSIDKCVKPDDVDTVYIANGCQSDRVLIECDGNFAVCVQNCLGEIVCECEKQLNGANVINVPVGGLITLKKA